MTVLSGHLLPVPSDPVPSSQATGSPERGQAPVPLFASPVGDDSVGASMGEALSVDLASVGGVASLLPPSVAPASGLVSPAPDPQPRSARVARAKRDRRR